MILGLNPQGLFLLREFAKTGQKVLAIGLKGSIGLYSKYGHKITIQDFNELEHVFSTKYLYNQTKIHITSDPFLNYLVDVEHEIFEKYQCSPNYKSAVIFRDKISTENLAMKIDIPCLRSYKLREIDEDNYDIFPSIVKWNRGYRKEKFKTMLINSQEDLKHIKIQTNADENLIVQRYIPGGPASDLSYGGYLLNGEEKFYIIVKQKRQYPNGLSSFVEEYKGEFVEQIRVIAKKILKETDHNGFAEVECRLDKKEKKVVLIEVNPRACGWIKIVREQFDDALLKSRDDQINLGKKPLCWVNIARDFRAILNLYKTSHNKINVKEIITDYLRNPVTDIFELNDIRPFIAQFKKIF